MSKISPWCLEIIEINLRDNEFESCRMIDAMTRLRDRFEGQQGRVVSLRLNPVKVSVTDEISTAPTT